MSTLTTIGSGNDPVTNGSILVKLVKKHERDKGVSQIQDELRAELGEIPGATVGFGSSHGPGGPSKPVSMSVRGDDLARLTRLAGQVESVVRATPGTVDVTNSLEISKPELRIDIDRERASDLGVNVGLIAASVRAMVDGYVATQYQEADEQIDTRIRLMQGDRTSLEDIRNLTIKSSKDGDNNQKVLIPVASVADLARLPVHPASTATIVSGKSALKRTLREFCSVKP